MSSALSFTFRPSLIPAYAQAEFLTRFCQLVLDYETLTCPVPEAPSADQMPVPSSFAPVNGDGAEGEVPAPEDKPKKERKNPWAGLTDEQRAERLAAMRRGRAAAAAERRLSEDSLNVPAPAPAPAPVAAVVEDAASESSSAKQRKNPWAGLTDEQRTARLAAMKAGREAKKAAAALASSA